MKHLQPTSLGESYGLKISFRNLAPKTEIQKLSQSTFPVDSWTVVNKVNFRNSEFQSSNWNFSSRWISTSSLFWSFNGWTVLISLSVQLICSYKKRSCFTGEICAILRKIVKKLVFFKFHWKYKKRVRFSIVSYKNRLKYFRYSEWIRKQNADWLQ